MIRIRLKDSVRADFVSRYCESASYWRQIAHNKGSNLKGGINASSLKGLLIPVPTDPQEQDSIVDLLMTVEAKQTSIRAQRATLLDTFQTLLYELMSGDRRAVDIPVDHLGAGAAVAE